MLIRSQESSYEVIRALPGEGKLPRFLCKNEEAGDLHILICMGPAEDLIDFFPILSDMDANPAFTDLQEYFLENDKLWMVFSWQEAKSLEEYIEENPPLTERFDFGRFVMERMVLMAMPPYLMLCVLAPEGIWVAEDKTPFFCYSFGAWRAFGDAAMETAGAKLGLFLKGLFAREEESGLYPEWTAWLETITPGDKVELLDIYKAYLELTPIFSEERKKEKRPGFKERCAALLPKAIGLFKIILGLTVLAAASAVAVGMWKDNVTPVLEAASRWKAVYVDGETLEPEFESETETEAVGTQETTEPESDPDNGRGRRYREDGSLCYEGGLKDGLYEGTGALYYPNGAVAYEGSFSLGRKEGRGYQYTDTGILYYEGEFKNDRFEGEGRLYDPDTGMLIYEGGFLSGRYGGEGVLYDPETELPKYVGGFRLGKYDGQGLEYGGTGSLLYEGDFLLGRYHGEGVLYDPGTGAVLAEGQFRNNLFAGPNEDDVSSGESGSDQDSGVIGAGTDEGAGDEKTGTDGDVGAEKTGANEGVGTGETGADEGADAGKMGPDGGSGADNMGINKGLDVEKTDDNEGSGPGDAKSSESPGSAGVKNEEGPGHAETGSEGGPGSLNMVSEEGPDGADRESVDGLGEAVMENGETNSKAGEE